VGSEEVKFVYFDGGIGGIATSLVRRKISKNEKTVTVKGERHGKASLISLEEEQNKR